MDVQGTFVSVVLHNLLLKRLSRDCSLLQLGNGEGFPSANWDLMPASVQLFFKAKNLSLLKVKTIVVHYYKSQCEGCIM